MTGPQYKRTSAAVLIIALAGLTLPLLFPLLSRLAPLGQCSSITLFGKPCPMCGLTRGFYHIWQFKLAEASAFNILSIPLFLFALFQAAFRIVVVTQIEKRATLLQFARPDAMLHIGLAAVYFVYSIGFVLIQWT